MTDAPITLHVLDGEADDALLAENVRLRSLLAQVRTNIQFDVVHNNDRVMAWHLRFLELSTQITPADDARCAAMLEELNAALRAENAWLSAENKRYEAMVEAARPIIAAAKLMLARDLLPNQASALRDQIDAWTRAALKGMQP
jgi:hypothetical protein